MTGAEKRQREAAQALRHQLQRDLQAAARRSIAHGDALKIPYEQIVGHHVELFVRCALLAADACYISALIGVDASIARGLPPDLPEVSNRIAREIVDEARRMVRERVVAGAPEGASA